MSTLSTSILELGFTSERDMEEALARQVMYGGDRGTTLRELDLLKRPGIAETIDWARALTLVGAGELDPDAARMTLGTLLKDRDDLEHVADALPDLLAG